MKKIILIISMLLTSNVVLAIEADAIDCKIITALHEDDGKLLFKGAMLGIISTVHLSRSYNRVFSRHKSFKENRSLTEHTDHLIRSSENLTSDNLYYQVKAKCSDGRTKMEDKLINVIMNLLVDNNPKITIN